MPLACVALADRLAAVGVRRDDRDQRLDAVAGEQFGDEADPLHVGVPVLAGEAEARGEELADLVAVEHLDAVALARAAGRPARTRWWSCPRSADR